MVQMFCNICIMSENHLLGKATLAIYLVTFYTSFIPLYIYFYTSILCMNTHTHTCTSVSFVKNVLL